MKLEVDRMNRICYKMGELTGMGVLDDAAARRNSLLYRREIQAMPGIVSLQLAPEAIYGQEKHAQVELLLRRYCVLEPCERDVDSSVKSLPEENVLRERGAGEGDGWEKEAASDIKRMDWYTHIEGSYLFFRKMKKQGAFGLQMDEEFVNWSIRLNQFFRKRGLLQIYYVPFARYLICSDWEAALEDGAFWPSCYLGVLETALQNTCEEIVGAARLQRSAITAISSEKNSQLLFDILSYIEETPVFGIKEVAETFQVAFNTASKMIRILEDHQLVGEISRKQRYRLYYYEKYVREYGGGNEIRDRIPMAGRGT